MRKAIIGWVLWFLAVTTIVILLNTAEQTKKQNEQYVPRQLHMDKKFLD